MLREHGTPKTPRDLREHRCLMGFARGETPQTQWPVSHGGTIHVDGAFFSNEPRLLAEAAVRGLGIALVPLLIATREIENGTLVEVLAGAFRAEARLAIVYAERELVPPHVRAFIDELAKWAPTELAREATVCTEPTARRTKRR